MARATVLALDVGGSKLAAALVRGAKVLDTELTPTPARSGPEAVVEALVGAARRLLERGQAPAPAVIGVASAGLVVDGRVRALSPDLLPGWNGFPLAERLEAAFFGLPAHALNDAQAAAYGEARHGAGRGRGSSLFVTVSTGVGGGLVLADTLWRGAGGMAGHVGHLGGRALERVASGTALAERAARLGHAVDARAVVAAAEAGEEWAVGLVTDAATALVSALVDVKYLVDPEVIVLGGGVGLNPAFGRAVQLAFEGVAESLRTPVVPAALGAAAGLVGAAAWALERRSMP